MYVYFALAILAILVLALSIFAKNTTIFSMFFPGIHEPLESIHDDDDDDDDENNGHNKTDDKDD